LSEIIYRDLLTFGLESFLEIEVILWFCEIEYLCVLVDDAECGESGHYLGVESRLTLNILCET